MAEELTYKLSIISITVFTLKFKLLAKTTRQIKSAVNTTLQPVQLFF